MAAQRLALGAGEDRGGGVGLDDLPQRLLDQLVELAAGPVAVVALPDPLVGVHGQLRAGRQQRAPRVSWQRCSGLDTIAASGSGGEPGGERRGLFPPLSSSATPGVQPASTPSALAVERPWRTRITVGMSATVTLSGAGVVLDDGRGGEDPPEPPPRPLVFPVP